MRANDGGIDVEVILENFPRKPDVIKRNHVVFQGKKEKKGFPHNKIIAEMKPKGELRAIILQLIQDKGSYIIVSSGDNCTPTKLEERLQSMKSALDGVENIHLDYVIHTFDANFCKGAQELKLTPEIRILK